MRKRRIHPHSLLRYYPCYKTKQVRTRARHQLSGNGCLHVKYNHTNHSVSLQKDSGDACVHELELLSAKQLKALVDEH